MSTRNVADERAVELGMGVNWSVVAATGFLGVLILSLSGTVCFVVARLPHPIDEKASNPPPPWETRAAVREKSRPTPHLVEVKSQEFEVNPPTLQPPPPEAASGTVAKPSTRTCPIVIPPEGPDGILIGGAVPQSKFHRRNRIDEAELRTQLVNSSHELDIDTEKGTTKRLSLDKSRAKTPPVLDLISSRDDLKGLPVRSLSDCQTSESEAIEMHRMSRQVRSILAFASIPEDKPGGYCDSDARLISFLRPSNLSGTAWRANVGVRMFQQMFAAESFQVRRQVVTSLAAVPGKFAGEAIARLAVFDLNSEVRESAVEALRNRPDDEWRPTLLASFRYPWEPVADHAAEALVALRATTTTHDLARLLDEPDPREPAKDSDGKWVISELVRFNHMGNCLLCHAPSRNSADPMRGVVPERGKRLPEAYYESQDGIFVRADINYLKQDFSILQAVDEPNRWPYRQRFDYLVRMRELTEYEVERLKARLEFEPRTEDYPQRGAVLWALRELTGQDMGNRAESWRKYVEAMLASPEP